MSEERIRQPVDTVGFAVTETQLRSVLARIGAREPDRRSLSQSPWRVAIAPHDDYAYVGELYPAVLDNVRARTVILIGVAHKARTLGLENELLVESFAAWSAPFGPVLVSPLRERIVAELAPSLFRVHDQMHAIEHSLEAIVPFLQARRRDLEIVPLLVPAMSFDTMSDIAAPLARVLAGAFSRDSLDWGSDVAIVISNDAVHYGDEGWAGRDFARYGVGTDGYQQALEHEHEIIERCLVGELSPERIRTFVRYTVEESDHREYRWPWCGRYSVPFGLLTAYYLQRELRSPALSGELIGYGTSVDAREHIAVDDLGMGVTAPASLRHWVGYASIGYP